MQPIETLSSDGFVVYRGVLSNDAANAARIIARRSHLP
ncbi:hypothetical protein F441_19088 [Phytophthora nicotianae CJ01A1]|nr:hypothetical protein F444_00338 [Phytophthora nicotianae P1976]ETP04059.1 hypothetical protein F441_19088 [Phytophthora nicotianae CJ01A1]